MSEFPEKVDLLRGALIDASRNDRLESAAPLKLASQSRRLVVQLRRKHAIWLGLVSHQSTSVIGPHPSNN